MLNFKFIPLHQIESGRIIYLAQSSFIDLTFIFLHDLFKKLTIWASFFVYITIIILQYVGVESFNPPGLNDLVFVFLIVVKGWVWLFPAPFF